MDVPGEDELDLADPLLHGLRLGLAPLVVLLEVVREVAVEVETPGVVPKMQKYKRRRRKKQEYRVKGVVPSLASLTSALASNFETIGVHTWHHVDPGVVKQPPDGGERLT